MQPGIPEAKESGRGGDGSATGPDSGTQLDTIELTRNRKTITASLQALARKYSLFEITLATDDGLVFASSAERDVQADAAKYSQIMKQKSSLNEPGVTLFELDHKGSHLVGIIRTKNELVQNGETGIREDTKGILQWWL